MVTIYGSAESVVLRIITIYEYYSRGEGKCLCFSDKIAKCFLIHVFRTGGYKTIFYKKD